MTHQEKASGWNSYYAIDCKTARKSLRYYKKKAHRKLRQVLKKENEDV
jgi:transcription initiation factor IIE alpha subunit